MVNKGHKRSMKVRKGQRMATKEEIKSRKEATECVVAS